MTAKPTNAAGKLPLRWGGGAARIAVIPGDGIGAEVTPEAVKVLKAVAAPAKRPLEFVEFDWSADKYLREGVTLPRVRSSCCGTNLTPFCLARSEIRACLRISM